MSPPASPPLPRGSGHILIVDDEPLLLDAISQMLERLGYRTTTAWEAEMAWKLLQQPDHGVQAVITDQTMPGMTGMELAKQIRGVDADLPIVICSGYTDRFNQEMVNALGHTIFLPKPITYRQLAEVMARVLASRPDP